MQLQYVETEVANNGFVYFQDIDELVEIGVERRKRSMKFKQERIFPAHKKSRVHRRKKRAH
ncbi:MAG: hypothetical protein CVV27_11635 [Candidatus Melainabacteria bacterium HGW-Melainabacteria-1]|nr:MAG: hypothetical protein CVV27_11635 [Candidatus Melainabacteria bacterium HGW-Melainabacteria-1]